jgi:hypothetical protein
MQMRNYFKYFLLVICSSLLIISCAPEDNTSPTPTDVRDKWIGTYTCEETENASNVTTFDISIRKNTATTDGLIISNFYNIGSQYNLNATLSGTSISINQQTLNGFTITGSGTTSGATKMNFNYSVQAGGNTSTCTAVATLQ